MLPDVKTLASCPDGGKPQPGSLAISLQGTRDRCPQRCFGRLGPQGEHVKIFLQILFEMTFPGLQRKTVFVKRRVDRTCPEGHILLDGPVTRRLAVGFAVGLGEQARRADNCDEEGVAQAGYLHYFYD